MTPFRPALGALLLLALAAPARAQGDDARLLPRGWVELRGSGIYSQFDTRFAPGGREPLGALFTGELQDVADRLLQPLEAPAQTALAGFFTQTASRVENPVSPAESRVGPITAQLAADLRRAPFTLSYGLASRLMVGLSFGIERNATAVAGIGFTQANLGLNPDATTNAAVLAKVGSEFQPLGSGSLLPVQGSAAGLELQRRVKALAGGDTLHLPVHALSVADLLANPALKQQVSSDEAAALGQVSQSAGYGLADVEIGARLLLLNSVHGYPVADSAQPRGMRSTLAVAARLPTGFGGDTARLLTLPRESRHPGISADLLNDWFLSRRAWLSASVGITHLLAANVERAPFSDTRLFPRDSLAPRTLRRTPGTRLRASLLPRFKLTREMSFALAYRFDHAQADRLEAADSGGAVVLGPLERTDAWTAHSVGFGGSYSTIEAFMAGRTTVPIEFSVLYRTTVAGSGYAPRAGTIEAGGRVLYQLLGRPRRARPDSVPAVPPPPPPGAAAPAPPGAPPP